MQETTRCRGPAWQSQGPSRGKVKNEARRLAFYGVKQCFSEEAHCFTDEDLLKHPTHLFQRHTLYVFDRFDPTVMEGSMLLGNSSSPKVERGVCVEGARNPITLRARGQPGSVLGGWRSGVECTLEAMSMCCDRSVSATRPYPNTTRSCLWLVMCTSISTMIFGVFSLLSDRCCFEVTPC